MVVYWGGKGEKRWRLESYFLETDSDEIIKGKVILHNLTDLIRSTFRISQAPCPSLTAATRFLDNAVVILHLDIRRPQYLCLASDLFLKIYLTVFLSFYIYAQKT